MISRRQFLGNIGVAGIGMASGFQIPLSLAAQNYTGKLFVLIQVEGGWDPTSFCDPKVNVPGEPEINHWSRTAGIQQAGNIPYAPFGKNAAFFNKYFDRTLVINGVDAQTNSHTAGVVHTYSGRISEGFPGFSALFSAVQAPDLSMSYLNFGGFAETAGIARYTRLDDPRLFLNVTYPNRPEASSEDRYIEDADWTRIRSAQDVRLADVISKNTVLPRNLRSRQFYQSAAAGVNELRAFADLLPTPDQLEPAEMVTEFSHSSIRQQMQVALIAFQAGVSVSADLFHGSFDTHENNDVQQEPLFAYLTDAIDYLWGTAETLNLADRLIVMIASDFGRTPAYNDEDGKDHWPINSVVFMEKNASWSNRVIGTTDEGHNAITIDPVTLKADVSGTLIYPKHVHKALRRYLGIESDPIVARFPFNQIDDMAFFG